MARDRTRRLGALKSAAVDSLPVDMDLERGAEVEGRMADPVAERGVDFLRRTEGGGGLEAALLYA